MIKKIDSQEKKPCSHCEYRTATTPWGLCNECDDEWDREMAKD